MFVPTAPDASASTVSPAHTTPRQIAPQSSAPAPAAAPDSPPPQLPPHEVSDDSIRHLLFGTLEAVQQTVHNLHSRGYAEPNDWSPAISTGRFNEVMKILIKRLPAD
ncbi:MAG: hypothetical protein WBG63_12235 [Phormidesmis sp.]